jgi:hypothetical protein
VTVLDNAPPEGAVFPIKVQFISLLLLALLRIANAPPSLIALFPLK